MKRGSSLRNGFILVFIVILAANVAYHADLVGRVAYAFERGKIQAGMEHLASIDSVDVVGVEKISHAFSVIAEAVKPSVVHIQAVKDNRQFIEKLPRPFRKRFEFEPRSTGTGSGVIIDGQGHIVTNNHVVSDCDGVFVTLFDGRRFKAEIVGTDPKTDLAVIQIDADRLHPARFGNSGLMKVGYMVLAIGSPFKFDHTVSHGIISALERHNVVPDIEYEGFLQTDAPINPGNSGGPLINTRGEVIGITTAIATESGGNQGVGFAIPSSIVSEIIDTLKSGEKVVRSYLNIVITTVDPQEAETYGLRNTAGVLVNGVKDGPGMKGGIKLGDIILAINDVPMHSSEELQQYVASIRPDTEIDVTVWRNKKERHLKVTVEEQPSNFSTRVGLWSPNRNRNDDDTGEGDRPEEEDVRPANGHHFGDFGFDVETVSPQLAGRYDLDPEIQTGAVVTDVDPVGFAYDAGLRPGFVITRVQDKRIRNVRQLEQALESLRDASSVRVWVQIQEDTGRAIFLRRK